RRRDASLCVRTSEKLARSGHVNGGLQPLAEPDGDFAFGSRRWQVYTNGLPLAAAWSGPKPRQRARITRVPRALGTGSVWRARIARSECFLDLRQQTPRLSTPLRCLLPSAAVSHAGRRASRK